MSRESHEHRATNLKVGAFLAVSTLTFVVAIFTVGQKSGLFEGKTEVYAHFGDINGLVEGAPVRLAGLDVGTVGEIRFNEAIHNQKARVTLSIKSRYMSRVRKDSVAFIDSKGLLGDKLINISLGSPNADQLQEGGTLPTKTAASFENLADKMGEAINSVTEVTKTADKAIQELTSEQIRKDVSRIASSVANILEEVEKGRGIVHDLVYDESLGTDLHGVLTDLRSAIGRVDRTVASIEHGDGLAHELFYGEKGKRTVDNLEQATTDAAALVKDARESQGLLHALVYDPENAKAVTELREASTRINRIMGGIEKGRGTLGALATDPSVYEDLKTILGNVERNVLLKALIRFTIKEGDIERPADQRVTRVPASD